MFFLLESNLAKWIVLEAYPAVSDTSVRRRTVVERDERCAASGCHTLLKEGETPA
jgi:hypothetical protein